MEATFDVSKEGKKSLGSFTATLDSGVVTWNKASGKGKKDKPAGTIALQGGITTVSQDGDSFTLGPDAKGTSYIFKAESADVAKEWVDAIEPILAATEDDFDVDAVAKQGWLSKKDKKHFYTLRDCTLTEWNKQPGAAVSHAKNYRKEVDLFECTVGAGDAPGAIVIDVKHPKANKWVLVGAEGDRDAWIEALGKEIAVAKERGPAAKRKKMKLGARMKKGLAQKVATSGAGKKAAGKAMPPEVHMLLTALKGVIKAYAGAKKAEEIENAMMKTIIKLWSAVDTKQVTFEELVVADQPLRKALRQVSLLWGGAFTRTRMIGQDYVAKKKEAFVTTATSLKEVESILCKHMGPILKPKNIAMIRSTLEFLRKPEFIRFVEENDDLEDEKLELEMAMDGYTSVELSYVPS